MQHVVASTLCFLTNLDNNDNAASDDCNNKISPYGNGYWLYKARYTYIILYTNCLTLSGKLKSGAYGVSHRDKSHETATSHHVEAPELSHYEH